MAWSQPQKRWLFVAAAVTVAVVKVTSPELTTLLSASIERTLKWYVVPGVSRLSALYDSELLAGLNDISGAFDEWLVGKRATIAARLKSAASIRSAQRSGRIALPFPRSDSSNNHLSLAGGVHQQLKLSSKCSRGRLRVGVLSFAANDVETTENVAFALGQEIITALAQFRWFDVIGGMSFDCVR